MDYLRFLEREIHTVVAATTDAQGLPVTCAIDIMDSDESGLYFLTARGKDFYRRLKSSGYLAFTGIKGADTLSRVAVSVRGRVRELESAPLAHLFKKNPYMEEIYPTEESRRALTVFQLYEGSGEWFDLSKKPIERFSFFIGQTDDRQKEGPALAACAGKKSRQTAMAQAEGYLITNACTGCRACETVCPQSCIDFTSIPAIIRKEHCLHCGNCMEICPQRAVTRTFVREPQQDCAPEPEGVTP